uniref:Tail protein n=1 Tax=viral metagenome TaxID=1070528 RepID=A0A6M3LJQ3_9ZZZZ
MALDRDVLDVNVRIQSPYVSTTGLGTPLIAGAATFAGEYVKSYGPDDDYASDTDLSAPIIAQITAAFSKSSEGMAPALVKVGKVDTDVAQIANLAITTSAIGKIYGVTIDGSSYTFVGIDALPATVTAALKVLIDLGGHAITVTDNGTDLDLTADVAGTPFTTATPSTVDGVQVLTTPTPNVSIKTSLDAIKAEDNDWFWLLTESQLKLDLARVFEWIALPANQPKFYHSQTADADVITTATDDIASVAKAANNSHVAVFYHPTAAQYPAAAWVGMVGSVNLDEKTTSWDKKTFTGTYTLYQPSAAIKTILEGKNCNWYDSFFGNGATYPGKFAAGNISGGFIDLRTSADWWGVRTEENIAKYMLAIANRNEKIPMSNEGIGLIEGWAREIYDLGVDIGHFTPESGVFNMPTLDPNETNTLSSTNRTNRHVPFTASTQALGSIVTAALVADLYA